MTIRYIGELYADNYAVHTREYGSLPEARDDLKGLQFSCEGDELLLFRCAEGESAAERHSRTLDIGLASHLLTLGPRGGVRIECLS